MMAPYSQEGEPPAIPGRFTPRNKKRANNPVSRACGLVHPDQQQGKRDVFGKVGLYTDLTLKGNLAAVTVMDPELPSSR